MEMTTFIDDSFLLNSNLAQQIYQNISNLPIIDYHSHLSAEAIYNDYQYQTITEMWLAGDHYKWRQMRASGIPEVNITGNGADSIKFQAYAKTLEYAIGNPLYHWSHLELKRYFQINQVLNQDSATKIYELANKQLQSGALSVRKLINKSNVKMIGTTDDICSDLRYHQLIAADETIKVKVLPTFRPDRFVTYFANYNELISELAEVTQITIKSISDFKAALSQRLDFFSTNNCIISDHGISQFRFQTVSEEEIIIIFNKIMRKIPLVEAEIIKYESYLQLYLINEYQKRNWVCQLHLGATRNNNQFLANRLGSDIGCDAISGRNYIDQLTTFLSVANKNGELPKMIIYNLNPQDNQALMALIGSFQSGPTPGRIQLGSAWWFNDHKAGIENHLETYQSLGLLRTFIGMLTDSRSFLSFTRHEYFRRILANHLANLVINGEYPNDHKLICQIATEISFENANRYFNLKEEDD